MTTRREEWHVGQDGDVYDTQGCRVAAVHAPSTPGRLPRAQRIAAVPDLEAIVEAVAGCVRYRAPDACGECIGCRAAAALRKSGRIP